MAFPAADVALFRLVNGGPHPAWLDAFVLGLTAMGAAWWPMIFSAPLGYFLSRDRWRQFWALLIPAALTATVMARLVKHTVARPRPFEALDGVRTLFPVDHLGAFGFPSTHATNTGLVAALAFAVTGASPGAFAFAVIALVTGWSRVYAGVHYPLDVAGGYALSAAVAMAALAARDGWASRRKTR